MKNKLIPLIYAVCFAVYILCGLFKFVGNSVFFKGEIDLPINEIEMDNLQEIGENTFVALTNDPQFIINIRGDAIRPRTIKYTLTQGGTGEKALYYKTEKQNDFSAKRCIIPPDRSKKTVEYILPFKNINCIRLDISGTAGEIIELEKVTLNFRPSFFSYFDFSTMAMAKLLVIPLLLASVIKYLYEMWGFYIKNNR